MAAEQIAVDYLTDLMSEENKVNLRVCERAPAFQPRKSLDRVSTNHAQRACLETHRGGGVGEEGLAGEHPTKRAPCDPVPRILIKCPITALARSAWTTRVRWPHAFSHKSETTCAARAQLEQAAPLLPPLSHVLVEVSERWAVGTGRWAGGGRQGGTKGDGASILGTRGKAV